MAWLQIKFVVNADIVDSLSDVLESFLAQAVTTENAGSDEFYEVAFPGTPDWKKVSLTALFEAEVDPEPIVDFVKAHFGEKEEIPIELSRLDDQDWERVWLENFKPIEVGKNLWVCPSWCEPEQIEARNIILDPGLAFGTGTHPTTKMCLQWIAEQDLEGQRVLDYGGGSGILAIASLFSGAKYADVVDIDPLAVEAANENALRNGVQAQLSSYLPDELPTRKYSLVIANILAEVLVSLSGKLMAYLEPGGTILLTGILKDQVETVIGSYPSSLVFKQYELEQWVLLVGVLKGAQEAGHGQ